MAEMTQEELVQEVLDRVLQSSTGVEDLELSLIHISVPKSVQGEHLLTANGQVLNMFGHEEDLPVGGEKMFTLDGLWNGTGDFKPVSYTHLDVYKRQSEDYVQVLLHQANVQNLVKKAAEADEEVNKIKAQKPEEAESAMGFFGKWGQYIMQSSMAESGQFYDAQAAIKKHDQEAYDVLLKNAENKRDGYLKKAEEEVKKAAEAAKKGNIGGHIDPKQSGKNPEAEAKQRLATERRLCLLYTSDDTSRPSGVAVQCITRYFNFAIIIMLDSRSSLPLRHPLSWACR